MAFTFGCRPQWVAQWIQSVGCHVDTKLFNIQKTPFLNDSNVFNENSIASLIAELMLMLGVDGP